MYDTRTAHPGFAFPFFTQRIKCRAWCQQKEVGGRGGVSILGPRPRVFEPTLSDLSCVVSEPASFTLEWKIPRILSKIQI